MTRLMVSLLPSLLYSIVFASVIGLLRVHTSDGFPVNDEGSGDLENTEGKVADEKMFDNDIISAIGAIVYYR